MIQFNSGEILNRLLSDGIVSAGATVVENSSAVFFVSDVFGTNITIKDADGNTVIVSAASHQFVPPLKLDGGFDISGTNLYVRYVEVISIPHPA